MKSARMIIAGSRQRGSITLVSLCLTIVMGISVSSYLALCTRSAQNGMRTLHQDSTRQLAEQGLEEALWALNQNQWSASGPNGTSAWSTSGSSRTVTLSYNLPGQNSQGQVAVVVSNYASAGPTWPSITATATLTLPGGQTFSKRLQAATRPAPLFGNAIASADSHVSFVSAGTVGSWNSDPDNNPATPAVPYSFTAGDPANYNAVVAGRGDGTYGVMLTQATVRGYVTTFGLPISHSTSGSPVARVLGPATSPLLNIDRSRLGKSAFIPTSAFTVSLPSTTGPNYGGLINNVLALVAALLSASADIDVYRTSGSLVVLGIPLLAPSMTIDRPLKLIVDGDLTISGAGRITVTPTGSLEIFVAGDVNIDGNGFRNQTLDPKKLAIFCSNGSTTDSVQYNTTEDFCGVIYSEYKPIDIRANATFAGALLSRQYVRFSAGATSPIFHYDTALRQVRFSHVSTPYLVKNVIEF